MNPRLRAAKIHYDLSRRAFPCDNLAVARPSVGPDILAPLLGSRIEFSKNTVWYHPAPGFEGEAEDCPAIVLDRSGLWWNIMTETLRECRTLGDRKYGVAIPSMNGGLDTLSALRDPQTLMMDVIDNPEWVEQKLHEINAAWRAAYDAAYEIVKEKDGFSAYTAFGVYGPGKCAQVQCDASAMISQDMFEQFELPVLKERCRHLDHSLYHLDGTQTLVHLDHLLSINDLDVIEWTPQDGIETGGDLRWHPLYRKILDAGKAVQVVNVKHHELKPLLDAIGTGGVYVMMEYMPFAELKEAGTFVENHIRSMTV